MADESDADRTPAFAEPVTPVVVYDADGNLTPAGAALLAREAEIDKQLRGGPHLGSS